MGQKAVKQVKREGRRGQSVTEYLIVVTAVIGAVVIVSQIVRGAAANLMIQSVNQIP